VLTVPSPRLWLLALPLVTGTSTSVFRALSAVDALTIFALGGTAFQGQSVWRSLDGGETWELVEDFGASSVFSDLHFFDAQRGIAVGFGVQRTEDGGETWTSVLEPAGVLQAVAFEGRLGWTVGTDASAHRSEDAGVTWTSPAVPEGSPTLLSVALAGTKVFVGAGDGVIYALDEVSAREQ
jgi:photosystem II stability/assembly factor-like uncharacterized protein